MHKNVDNKSSIGKKRLKLLLILKVRYLQFGKKKFGENKLLFEEV